MSALPPIGLSSLLRARFARALARIELIHSPCSPLPRFLGNALGDWYGQIVWPRRDAPITGYRSYTGGQVMANFILVSQEQEDFYVNVDQVRALLQRLRDHDCIRPGPFSDRR